MGGGAGRCSGGVGGSKPFWVGWPEDVIDGGGVFVLSWCMGSTLPTSGLGMGARGSMLAAS